MIWWFLIFAFGAGAVLWAAIAAYLRVRQHMKDASSAKKSGAERGADG
jgi:ABC-type uncharacterized transport system permease subunit